MSSTTIVSFWSNDPTILFQKKYIMELWPNVNMGFEAKLNAISRLVLLMTILGYIVTRNTNIIIIGFLTIALIYSIYKLRKQQYIEQKVGSKEGFKNNKGISINGSASTSVNGGKNSTNNESNVLNDILQNDFNPVTKKNPMGNVLLTDIGDNPERLSAPPSFNPEVHDTINKQTQKQTQMLYPGIKNTSKQLYGDLYEQYTFDNDMMRNFYSTANTRVANDQGAFGEWLYGNMPSSKSSGQDGAFARVQDSQRHIMM
jgi:hypothetical protein